jgi:dienelactone hydrolase
MDGAALSPLHRSRLGVTGVLSRPEAATGPVPAVVIVHGSSGVNPGEWVWAKRMNALGFASFVVDSFIGRGITQTETDQTQLSMTADIADALAALRLLATHPRSPSGSLFLRPAGSFSLRR